MINEDQAAVVRKIFDLYLKGYSVDKIMKEAHAPINPIEVFEQVQEEMKRRGNIEVVDGKAKRKNTHYSAKNTEG